MYEVVWSMLLSSSSSSQSVDGVELAVGASFSVAGVLIIMFLGSVLEKITKKRQEKYELAVLE